MISTVLEISLSVSVVILLVLILNKFIDKRYMAKGKYILWLILAVRLLIPVSFALPEAPVTITAPERTVVISPPGAALPVTVMPETPLKELLGKEQLAVNSCHHQGIRDLANDLRPMAVAEDGLVEAVYLPSACFVWAVQWHPEFFPAEDWASNLIFKAFVEECK